jgi:hypothetical protein
MNVATKYNSFATVIMLLALICMQTAKGHQKVVVVPLIEDNAAPLANTVTVSLANGDFNNPLDALASITDASAQNPYLIVIGPGTYIVNQPLIMKPFVNIVGSGRTITILKGAVASNQFNDSAAFLITADNTRISDLSIENNAAGLAFCFAIKNSAQSNNIVDVNVMVSGCTFAVGIQNSSAKTAITRSVIKVLGNNNSVGIDNSTSTLDVSHTTIFGSGNISNVGVRNNGGHSVIRNSRITVSGGGVQTGVLNGSDSSSARIVSSEISATSIHAVSTNMSLIAASGFGTNETYVANSFFEGSTSGTPVCVNVFTFDGGALAQSCAPT